MNGIRPTEEHLSDPFVLQLMVALAERDDEIERLEAVHKRDLAEYNRVAKENTHLKAALQEIASQGRPVEYDEEQRDSADYETGYDMCILTARGALQGTKR